MAVAAVVIHQVLRRVVVQVVAVVVQHQAQAQQILVAVAVVVPIQQVLLAGQVTHELVIGVNYGTTLRIY
jgi:hypothetical protein